jgi:hypothetical protein
LIWGAAGGDPPTRWHGSGVTWEQIGNLAEDLSGIAAGGSFEHKDFRINEVSSCFVKINIMFSNALL